ncbi:Nuclear factor NF-kappa-B p100 subunit [Aspergillus nanangensis]|uniref:Nuclear factor NF-kappa-B p100 subunit n=1 Tax=Aspergillus nanangensis TaxID=2582783 RepID=A0AAD4CXB4_ASPNN|nr:Nuclear factor NF-kappa-B p100 subunit [Aspergillus nanangensis]
MAGHAPEVLTGAKDFRTISDNRGVIVGDASGNAQLIGSQTNYIAQHSGVKANIQISLFKTSTYESFKNFNPKRVPDTCEWFLEHEKFEEWKASDGADIFWLFADPGCGKSVLARALVDEKNFYEGALGDHGPGSKLKFLITSRPYKDIERPIRSLASRIPIIQLNAEDETKNIRDEISIVVVKELEEIAVELELPEDVRSSLQQRLSEIPNRTYLWLRMILSEIRSAPGRSPKKLLRVIDNLPETVEQAYEKILERCTEKDARLALEIIVAAKRPLTVAEIDVALEIGSALRSSDVVLSSYKDLDLEGDKRKEWLRMACGLFVSIVDSQVYLIHQTAREFLIQQGGGQSPSDRRWRQSVNYQEAQRILSKICISHLLFPDFDYRRYRDNREYSAGHWMVHFQEAHMDEDRVWISKAAELCNNSDRFLSMCVHTRNYLEMLELFDPPRSSTTRSALHWSLIFRLLDVTKFIVHSGVNRDLKVGPYGNALETAVTSGHEESVEILLLIGANMNISGGSGWNTLETACAQGHISILNRLL